MVDKICSTVRRGIYMVCCVLLACQVLIVSGVAASRYILKHTPPWGENLALICMVWFCLLSSAVAISEDLHLKVTLIDNFISDRTRTIMDLLDLLLVFIFGVFMVFGSYAAGTDLQKHHERHGPAVFGPLCRDPGFRSGLYYSNN